MMQSSQRTLALVAILSLVGAALVLIATQRYGIGLQSDSVGYVQIAREILQGRGISPAFTLQPPLYPALLALGGAITFSDPLNAAVWVNALLFAGVIFLSGLLFFRHLRNFPALALLGTFGVLVSRPLLNVTLIAFSELFFILLVLSALVSLQEFAATNKTRWLILAILAMASACLTRYIGVTLIAAGGFALLWMLRRQPRRAIFAASTFVLLSALPWAIWALRNILVSGEPFGDRAASRSTLIENVNLTVGTLVNWFVPDQWAWIFGVACVLLVGALLIMQFGRIASRGEAVASATANRVTDANVTASPLPLAPSLAPTAFFVAFFVAFLIITSTTTAYNRIGTRLLSPIYVPMLMLALVAVDRVLAPLHARAPKAVINGFALLAVALSFLFPSQTNWARIGRAVLDGAGGYSLTSWRTSETINYVRAHRGDFSGTIFTNGPDVLYILADLDARSIPPKFQYASNELANNANNLRGTYPPEPSTLVWLDNIERDDFLFTLPDLKDMTRLTLIAKLQDGAVYHMERK